MSRSRLVGLLAAALALAPAIATAGRRPICEPSPSVSVDIAPLELAAPPTRPERFYPEAARRSGIAGAVTLECEAAGGALGKCVVDAASPRGAGFAASALRLARTLDVRTEAVAQIVKLEVRYGARPPAGAPCRATPYHPPHGYLSSRGKCD